MSLYEIDKKILELVNEETGEIADFEKFEQLNVERENKIENIALLMKNVRAEKQACNNEKNAFAKREKSCDNLLKRLENLLKESCGNENFISKDGKVKIQFKKTPESVVIADGTILPPVYLRYREPEPDKIKLKEALKAGESIDGVSLQSGISVIVK